MKELLSLIGVFFKVMTAEKSESSILKMRFESWISLSIEEKDIKAAIFESESEIEFIFCQNQNTLSCLFSKFPLGNNLQVASRGVYCKIK